MEQVSACADIPPLMWGKRVYPYPGKFIGSGNRCGHDPDKFASERLDLPQTKGGHWPQAIKRLMKGVQDYFSDPESVTLLAHANGKTRLDGAPRLNRSEGRETHGLILTAIFSRLDLKSLRVGTYTPQGKFKPASCDELARYCSLTRPSKDPEQPHVSSSRWWRGIAQLKRLGVIDVFEQYEETPDGPRARPAIKVVNEDFLVLLSRMPKAAFKQARKAASKKVAKYLGGAVDAGIQSDDEREQLTDKIRSKGKRDELFPKPAIKNQQPAGTIEPDADLQVEAYKAHSEQVHALIVEALDRQPTLKEHQRLYAQYGGLSWLQWLARRR